jgi:Protein tyrosine phosphatase-like protein, PTPLA
MVDGMRRFSRCAGCRVSVCLLACCCTLGQFACLLPPSMCCLKNRPPMPRSGSNKSLDRFKLACKNPRSTLPTHPLCWLQVVGLPLRVAQTAAVMEVVHAATGIVKSPVAITGVWWYAARVMHGPHVCGWCCVACSVEQHSVKVP